MAASKVRPVYVVLGVIGVLGIATLYWVALSGRPGTKPTAEPAAADPSASAPSIMPRVDIERIRQAVGPDGLLAMHIDFYRKQVGRYPRGLEEIVGSRERSTEPAWGGPYLNNPALLRDPWGRAYHYVIPGRHNPATYDLWSAGADGISGTADDVGNW